MVVSLLSVHACLKFACQKMGVGTYSEKPLVRITHIHTNHGLIKMGGGHLHGEAICTCTCNTRTVGSSNGGWALTRENTAQSCSHAESITSCDFVPLQVERGILNLAGAKVQYTDDQQRTAAVRLEPLTLSNHRIFRG